MKRPIYKPLHKPIKNLSTMPEVSISLLKILVIFNHNRVLFSRPDNSDLQTKFQCFVNDFCYFLFQYFLINRLLININSCWLMALARSMHDQTYKLSLFCVYTCIYSTLSQNTRTSSQMRQEALKCTGIVFVFGSWF